MVVMMANTASLNACSRSAPNTCWPNAMLIVSRPTMIVHQSARRKHYMWPPRETSISRGFPHSCTREDGLPRAWKCSHRFLHGCCPHPRCAAGACWEVPGDGGEGPRVHLQDWDSAAACKLCHPRCAPNRVLKLLVLYFYLYIPYLQGGEL